jgi:hypothetical protein
MKSSGITVYFRFKSTRSCHFGTRDGIPSRPLRLTHCISSDPRWNAICIYGGVGFVSFAMPGPLPLDAGQSALPSSSAVQPPDFFEVIGVLLGITDVQTIPGSEAPSEKLRPKQHDDDNNRSDRQMQTQQILAVPVPVVQPNPAAIFVPIDFRLSVPPGSRESGGEEVKPTSPSQQLLPDMRPSAPVPASRAPERFTQLHDLAFRAMIHTGQMASGTPIAASTPDIAASPAKMPAIIAAAPVPPLPCAAVPTPGPVAADVPVPQPEETADVTAKISAPLQPAVAVYAQPAREHSSEQQPDERRGESAFERRLSPGQAAPQTTVRQFEVEQRPEVLAPGPKVSLEKQAMHPASFIDGPDRTQRPSAPLREIAVRLPDPGNGSVDLRIIERAGRVQVDVRTPNTQLTQDLRTNLDDLVSNLRDRGFRAETSVPDGSISAAASISDSGRNLMQDSTRDPGGPGPDSSGGQQQQPSDDANNRQRRRPEQLWADYIDQLKLSK